MLKTLDSIIDGYETSCCSSSVKSKGSKCYQCVECGMDVTEEFYYMIKIKT